MLCAVGGEQFSSNDYEPEDEAFALTRLPRGGGESTLSREFRQLVDVCAQFSCNVTL